MTTLTDDAVTALSDALDLAFRMQRALDIENPRCFIIRKKLASLINQINDQMEE